MNIIPLQFNFIKPKPQSAVTSPLRIKNQITADTVSFSGNTEPVKKPDPLDKLIPKHKGIIYKKGTDENGNRTKTPVKVDIENNKSGLFLFKIGEDIIGGVSMTYLRSNNPKEPDLTRDYEEEGIVGDRIYVDYVENYKQEEYGGVAHLADLLEVAACKEFGIDTNVISLSRDEAAPMHYARGKRFIPFEKYDKELYEKYDNREPNEVVKNIVERTPKGEKYDTSEIKDMFITYMPKSMAKELEEELKKNPIF